ncbi:hypothetical protein XmelCFBP4644_07215 [Xanthomonas melonis]|uniref:Uncharacterized protein n=1 Tax=Xanthomonas melonis TaxID=56456 RepID=A0A2S7DHU2_9XANT|nr:hypothetical protein XmelCFBP4644_07215 [Xanthomonas melonis]
MSLCGHRLRQQGVQPRKLRLQAAQLQRNRRDPCLRHLQRAGQRQRALRGGDVADRDRRACLHHRGRAGPRQPGARLAAVAVQRQRSGEQLARAIAVGSTELAARQCRIAPLQQSLNAGVRP